MRSHYLALMSLDPQYFIERELRRAIVIRPPTDVAPLRPPRSDIDLSSHPSSTIAEHIAPWSKGYPILCLILYSTEDKRIVDFISDRKKIDWLHHLSGSKCFVGVYENPSEWHFSHYWEKKLGKDEFRLCVKEWKSITPEDRNNSFRVAELLGITKSSLPCIVFIDSSKPSKTINIPLSIKDEQDYVPFFKELFTIIQSCLSFSIDKRFKKLKLGLKRFSGKWKLIVQFKEVSHTLKEITTAFHEELIQVLKLLANKGEMVVNIEQAAAVGKYARSDNNTFLQSELKQTLSEAAAEIQQPADQKRHTDN